ncbi:MAG: PilZ domain-containing protein [Bdellovibrionota bacterium]
MMDGKRKDKRVEEKKFVCFEGEGFQVFSQTRNVSSHGAFISTHYLLEPGTEIEVTFVDDEEKIPFKAKVVHTPRISDGETDVDQSGFGVEIL